MRYRLLTLLAFWLLVSGGVKAQDSVILKATVSETVVLSVASKSFADGQISSSGNTVRITLADPKSAVVRVPLLVRSNSGFKISATFESQTATLSELSVVDMRAMGSLVSPSVINTLHAEPQFDPDTSQPLIVVSGPRVSLGGSLNSPNNALEITLLIRLKPELPRESLVHLTLAATPVPLIQ